MQLKWDCWSTEGDVVFMGRRRKKNCSGVTHLGLFEGIGGFSLARSLDGMENSRMVRMGAVLSGGIKKISRSNRRKSTWNITKTNFTKVQNNSWHSYRRIPLSALLLSRERRKGTADPHLWPEMLRAIREVQPRYVVGKMFAASLIGTGIGIRP